MDRPPALAPELVNRFVSVAHGDLETVQTLLKKEPRLVNAAWDWGGGDWETGLGAAAHTGQHAIANLLLAQGAHIDIFAAAMLGKLSIVTAILADNPAVRHNPGPHGIPLLVHARNGGAAAADVVAYLEALDAGET